ncbi:MAG: barstar family protein [Clostridia bacterium]|nr:barstar family protein [Clostridia bacterium]
MQEDIANYTVDFKDLKDYMDLHHRIKESMEFPQYYGCNLDALWDCLTDLICFDYVTIRFVNFQTVERKYPEEAAAIVEELYDLKHIYKDEYYDVFAVFVERNGVTQEIL